MAGKFNLRKLRVVLWVLVAFVAGGVALLSIGSRMATVSAVEAI